MLSLPQQSQWMPGNRFQGYSSGGGAVEEGFDFGDEETTIYEVCCPVCNHVINFDEETLESGSIPCPQCGENLEFSFDDEDEEELEF